MGRNDSLELDALSGLTCWPHLRLVPHYVSRERNTRAHGEVKTDVGLQQVGVGSDQAGKIEGPAQEELLDSLSSVPFFEEDTVLKLKNERN